MGLISTKQASKILRVSISTIGRYFDRGLLQGEKHPLTGRRKISEDSIKIFLKKYAPEFLPTEEISKEIESKTNE